LVFRFCLAHAHAFVLPHVKDWQSADKVRFNASGNEKLEERVSESIQHPVSGRRR
jgi:hypothetical protein